MRKNKFGHILVLGLFLFGCSQQHDAYYYASHPKALQEALGHCPNRAPSGLSCDELQKIAEKMSGLVDAFRRDQLGYGRDIMALQEQANAYRQTLHAHPDASTLESLKQVEAKIQEHLLPIQWLTSPRNRS